MKYKYSIYVNNKRIFVTSSKAEANKQYVRFRRIYLRCNVRLVEE